MNIPLLSYLFNLEVQDLNVPVSTSTSTDDSNGSASSANKDVDALNDDAEETEECSSGRVASFVDGVATLSIAGVALANRDASVEANMR